MRRWVTLLGVGVAIGIVAACAPPSVDGPNLSTRHLPSRKDDGNTQATATTDAGNTVAPPVIVAPVDAGPPASKACTGISGAALCFTFEGSSTSSSTLQPTVVTGIDFVPGRENEAASFTSGSEFRFAPSDAFELPAGAATIEAWIKRKDTGADAVVFDDDGRFSLTINAAGVIVCRSSGGAVTGTAFVEIDQWQHVACVVDAGTLHAYLNGTQEAAGPGAIGSAPTLAASLGANSPPGAIEGDQAFVGLIDSFRLLSVARTADQMKADASD